MKSSEVTQNSSTKNHQFLFLILLVVTAVVSRFYGLTFKPVHFDEGINGWFSSQVQQFGFYRYDPNNYHGPLYFYVLRFFEMIFGKSLTTLRAVPGVFAVLSVLLFMLPLAGTRAWRRWAAGLLLLSPAFIFFGRSGIHEMPFVFFQLVFALGILRSFEKKDGATLNCLMIGLFGMITLKETFAVTLFSFAVALLSVGPRKLKEVLSLPDWKRGWGRRQSILLLFLLCMFFVLFTGFFRDMSGIVNFFRAFLPWMKTGVQGSGHDKPFYYWLVTLWYAEPLVLLGIVFSFSGSISRNGMVRVISVFSLVQFVVYSLIPYKTVWCIVTLVWGFYLVISFQIVRTKDKKVWQGLCAVVALGGLFNIWSIYDSSYRNPINLKHHYVYVNSTYELNDLYNYLEKQASKQTSRVQVGMLEQWPWPWLLRDFSIVSYETCGKNFSPDLEIYFCDASDKATVESFLTEPYWRVEFEFRQDKGALSFVYLKKSVFSEVPFPRIQEVSGEP